MTVRELELVASEPIKIVDHALSPAGHRGALAVVDLKIETTLDVYDRDSGEWGPLSHRIRIPKCIFDVSDRYGPQTEDSRRPKVPRVDLSRELVLSTNMFGLILTRWGSSDPLSG